MTVPGEDSFVASLAQLDVHLTNYEVAGSTPAGSAIFFCED